MSGIDLLIYMGNILHMRSDSSKVIPISKAIERYKRNMFVTNEQIMGKIMDSPDDGVSFFRMMEFWMPENSELK